MKSLKRLPKFGADPDGIADAHRVFFAERLDGQSVKQWQKRKINDKMKVKKAKEKRGKLLNFKKASAEVQAGLLEARAVEWKKWVDFNAGIIVMGEQLDDLLREGHQEIPTQWIEVDKNEAKRKPGEEPLPPIYKSRLVGRGDLEKGIENIRSDSPTCDIEAQNLIFMQLHTSLQ